MKFWPIYLAIVICGGVAWAQPVPTFSLDFKNGVDGVGRDGKMIPARVEGKVVLVDGKFGKAFKSGPDSGYLHFPTQGIVSPTQGTVEMWVCPLDWTGDEQRFHVFFDARGDGALYLYKFFHGGLLMLTAPSPQGPFHSAEADIKDWKPGEWHFIAGTWSAHHQAVYVDGKKLGMAEPDLPRSISGEFTIGDNPWNENIGVRTSSSLIDRVRIYDRALSDEHIAAHFAGDYGKVIPLSATTGQLDFSIDPKTLALTATADASGVDVPADAQASFSLDLDGKTVAGAAPQPFGSGSATTQLSLAGLKPATYTLSASIRSAGADMTTLTSTVTIPSLEWLGNKLGLDDKVLPPWTPLQVHGGGKTALEVRCWGRTYRFDRAALPSQITSSGQPLLARPVSLNVDAGGQSLHWTQGSIRVISASPTAVNLVGGAQADVPGGVARLTTRLRIEYDGMMLIDTSLQMPAGVTVDSVSLNLPVLPERALYRHRWSEQWTGNSGNVPAGQGVVDSSDFVPFAWLGDNDRGLFWFCESGQHWPNYAAKNAFETVREDDAVTLRLNLLAQGQALPAGWDYQFGIQATPVKPVPADWRKWRMQPGVRGNIAIIWPAPPSVAKDSMKYFGSPIATDPPAFTKRVDALHAQGVKVVPYSWLTFVSTGVPEWEWFKNEWKTGNTDTTEAATWGYITEGANPYSRSYSDYVIWRNYQSLTRYKLDGYYHDQTHPYAFFDAERNLGWRDAAGVLHPIYPILAYRALYKRLYSMVKTVDPHAFLIAHMSGKITIPVLSFEDAYLDGENFRGKVEDSYMDVSSLDYWRAELTGRQWGLEPYFLPEFNAKNRLLIAPSRGLVALLLLHDQAVWPIWGNLKVFDAAFDALDKFGYVDSTFIPYFDAHPPASTDLKDIYVSVYKRADGRALVVVGNVSKQERAGTVTLDAKRIGLPLDKIVSWPDGAPMAAVGGAVQVDVPGLDYRLLLVGKAPVQPSAR